MINEIAVAAKFLATLAPLDHQEAFRVALCSALAERLSGHWYPETPNRGSGYRAVSVFSSSPDSLLRKAAAAAGLPTEDLTRSLPADLSVWVDPLHVSYRQGEHGYVLPLWDPQSIHAGGSNSNNTAANSSRSHQGASSMHQFSRSPPVKLTSTSSPITIKPPSPKAQSKPATLSDPTPPTTSAFSISSAPPSSTTTAVPSHIKDTASFVPPSSNSHHYRQHYVGKSSSANGNSVLLSSSSQSGYAVTTTSAIKLSASGPNTPSNNNAITLAA